MDDQRTDRESGKSVAGLDGDVEGFGDAVDQDAAAELPWEGPSITSTPRERILAGVLSLVYIGGWALTIYAYSNRIEDHWPARVFWVVFATWVAIMLPLPLVAACWFFGIDRSPAWMRGRFSLRTLLIVITLVAVVLGVIVWATTK
jgi:hypothetical protein